MAIKGNMDRPCVVYLVTNRVTGKRYIGISGQKNLGTRISQHFAEARRKVNKGAFHRALRKYGREAFEWTVLEKCETVTVALSREIELIASMKPEYNSTKGGDGARGYLMSPENRRRLSDFHKGKSWHSMPHSEATKAKLREIGRASDGWKRIYGVGPAAAAKRVVCLDDGKSYSSLAEAARAYGTDTGLLSSVCQRKRATACGRVFRYEGDHHGGPAEGDAVKAARTRTSEKRPVICLNDNMLFDTKKLAAKFYGIGTNTVARSCGADGKITAAGKAFNFLDEWCPNPL